MPLRADMRRAFEIACRLAAFAILALLVIRSTQPVRSNASRTSVATASDLERLTKSEQNAHLHFSLSATPSRAERAWQKALSDAGSKISWSGALTPVALAARTVNAPRGGHLLAVSAPGAESIFLRDDISVIDSLKRGDPVLLPLAVSSGPVRASAESGSASVILPEAAQFKRVLILGKAGWEAKFVVTALEESGWDVDATLVVAPGAVVNQGSTTIDTAHYAAVIALDESAAARAPEISRFVRSGGGLILGVRAARTPAFAPLRISAPRAAPEHNNTDDSVTHTTAAFSALTLSTDAVALERGTNGVSVGARRVAFGRVVQVGYNETWRWRMQGAVYGKTEHRDWWTQLLSQVVHVDRSQRNPSLAADPAPYPDLVHLAGPPTPLRTPPSVSPEGTDLLLALVLFALLTAEWASRRLRGAR